MNCKELRYNIEKLKSLSRDFKTMLEPAKESRKGKTELSSAAQNLNETLDKTLEHYLLDFAEYYPEIRAWQVDKQSIKGLDDFGLFPPVVSSLPDGSILIGGFNGVLRRVIKNEDGSLQPGERIEGFEDGDGTQDDVTSIAPLPNGVLIGGGHGSLYCATKGENGEYKLGEQIEIRHEGDEKVCITSIVTLPDGGALIGGWSWRTEENTLFYITEKDDGTFESKELDCNTGNSIRSFMILPDKSIVAFCGGNDCGIYPILKDEDDGYKLGEGVNNPNNEYDIAYEMSVAAALPDGGILVGGEEGILYYVTKDDNGKLTSWEKIDCLISPDSYRQIWITSIAALPDGGILVGEDYGDLYYIKKDKDGKFEVLERVLETQGYQHNKADVTVTSEDGALINIDGAFFRAKKTPLSVDTIKRNLDILAAKKASH